MAHRSFLRPHNGLLSTRDELATSTQDQGAKVTWAGQRQEAATVVLPKGWSSGCAYQSLVPLLITDRFKSPVSRSILIAILHKVTILDAYDSPASPSGPGVHSHQITTPDIINISSDV